MEDQFNIRNSHTAILHLLLSFISSQKAFNEEILVMIGDTTKYDINLIRKRMNERADVFHHKFLDKLFQEYGILDVDDILKQSLDDPEE